MIISNIRRAVAGLPDQTIPEPPINFTVQPGDTEARLTWFRNEEPDIAGYNIYRSLSSGSGYTKIVTLTTALTYLDTSLSNSTTYYYVITAEDEDGNESAYSDEVSATPASGGSGNGVAYLYYRVIGLSNNSTGDTRSVWREIKGYEANDNTGTNVFNDSFDEAISSSAPNEDHLAFDEDPNTYWDSFPSASGNHRWIGVKLTTAKTVRSATLDPYAHFWQPASMKFQGSQDGNTWYDLKTFNTSYNTSSDTVVTDIQGSPVGDPVDTTPPSGPTGLSVSAGDTVASLSWTDNTEGDLAGYNVYRSTTSGSGYSKLNTNPVTVPSYLDSGLSNGTTYYYVITAEDDTLPANESGYSSEVSVTPVADVVEPAGDITTLDVSWCSVQLSWTQDTATNNCVIIQRKTGSGSWVAPNFSQPLGWSNYKRLGSKAFNFYDLDVNPGTTYYYRVASITNASAWVNNGTAPTLSSWKYGNATTPNVTFQTFRVTDYGADPTGASNSYQAIVDCYAAALAARTASIIPEVYFPNNGGSKATYLSYPTDSSVQLYGGTQNYVTYANRNNYDSYLFTGRSNVRIRGQLSNSGERPELKVKQWNNQDSTNWLARLASGGSNPTSNADLLGTDGSDGIIRHGFMAIADRTENLVVKDLWVNGTGYPVNRGKQWYTADEKKYQWDISHKGIAAWNAARNIICDNVKIDNFRAECFYVGGRTFESWRMADCEIGNTNSSAISMSSCAEIENCDIYDASNAGVESAIFHNLTSSFNGASYTQYHLISNTSVHCLDQRSSTGVFKDLPGDTEFGGIYIFNEDGAWWDLAEVDIYDMPKIGIAGWYGCYNASSWRLRFNSSAEGGWGKQFFSFTIFPKPQYLLAGGMDNCYFLDTEVSLSTNMENGSQLLYTIQGNAVNSGGSDNVIFDKLYVYGNGYRLNVVWTDQWTQATGRDNFTLKNWDYINLLNNAANFVVSLSGGAEIQPFFSNVDFLYKIEYASSGQLRLKWNNVKIGSTGNIEIINIDKLKEEQPYTLSTNGGTVTLPSAAWNTWGVNQTIGAGQTLQVQRASGTSQLELV